MAPSSQQVALAFLDTFETLDADANIALRTDDCRHTIAPLSLKYTPDMTNDQYRAHFAAIKPLLSAFPVHPIEILEQENIKQVTIWATSDAIFREEAKDDDTAIDWTYHGEYIFIFRFNQAGDKIERVFEFVDSQKVVQIRGLIERAIKNLTQ